MYKTFMQSRRVIVTLLDGTSIEGMFWRKRGSLLVLKQATLHQPRTEPVPLDGDFIVERPQVLFIQVL